MYKTRFRNKNALQVFGDRKIDIFTNNGICTVAPSWAAYAIGNSGAVYTTVDTMDDIAGDRPDASKGPAGFKFHPMTKVKAVELPGNATSWTIRHDDVSCQGTGQPHNIQVKRLPTGDTHRKQCGLAIPMIGDRLDMSKVPYPAVDMGRIRDLAETACLAKRGRVGGGNLYESLAEVNKSVGFLKDLLGRANRIQNTAFFGKAGSSRLRSFNEEAAGQYLATRYGFVPIVKDIESILLGLQTPLGRRIITTRAKERLTLQQTESLPTFSDSGHVLFSGTRSTAHQLYVEAVSVDNVEITLLRALGLGGKDLFGLPYELLTYSFVADWFANIGDVISAIAPEFGFYNVGQSCTIDWNCAESVVYSTVGIDGAGKTLLSHQAPSYARTIHYRDRSVGPLVPHIRWRSDFKFDSPTRVLDTLALFTARASKIKATLAKNPPNRRLLEGAQKRGFYFSNRGTRDAWDFRGLSD